MVESTLEVAVCTIHYNL